MQSKLNTRMMMTMIMKITVEVPQTVVPDMKLDLIMTKTKQILAKIRILVAIIVKDLILIKDPLDHRILVDHPAVAQFQAVVQVQAVHHPQVVLQVVRLLELQLLQEEDGSGLMPLENGNGQKLQVRLWRHLLVRY